jgi:hypothetical protein
MPQAEYEEQKLQTNTPCEGSELNGEKASFRNGPLRSEGLVWPRMRLPNGATVPLPRRQP